MIKSFVLLLALVGCSLAVLPVDLRREFADFQQRFNRSYASQTEFNLRYRNFVDNHVRSQELNRLNPRATFGVNKFSDMSKEEFAQKYLGSKPNTVKAADISTATNPPRNVRQCSADPQNWNWQDCGATTGIYNQGQCGSCWAFSATETIESYYFLAGNALTQLSMEQIVDCDTTSDGCGGGTTQSAYSYVAEAGGIDSYNSYPYIAESGNSGSCNFASSQVVTNVANYYSVNGETGLYAQASSSSGGPVSVCVDASTWQTYTSGVLTSCPDSIDHCVQLVGYANYGGSNAYWLVRNSWGSDWGNNGLIYVAIGQDLCAIGDDATIVSTN